MEWLKQKLEPLTLHWCDRGWEKQVEYEQWEQPFLMQATMTHTEITIF